MSCHAKDVAVKIPKCTPECKACTESGEGSNAAAQKMRQVQKVLTEWTEKRGMATRGRMALSPHHNQQHRLPTPLFRNGSPGSGVRCSDLIMDALSIQWRPRSKPEL